MDVSRSVSVNWLKPEGNYADMTGTGKRPVSVRRDDIMPGGPQEHLSL